MALTPLPTACHSSQSTTSAGAYEQEKLLANCESQPTTPLAPPLPPVKRKRKLRLSAWQLS